MAEDEVIEDAELEGEAHELEGEGMGPEDEEVDSRAEEHEEDETSEAEGEAPELEEREGGLPRGVKRRLDKLTAKFRAAERERDEAQSEVERLKALSGERDPKVLLAVAEKHGILPEIMGARDAEGLRKLEKAEASLNTLEDLLDELEDSGESEATVSGKSYTLGELRRMRRQAEREQESLRETFLSVRKELSKRTAKLLKLGLAAEAARAKGKAESLKRKRVAEAEDEDEDGFFEEAERMRKRKGAETKKRTRQRELGGFERGSADGREASRRFIIENFLKGDD